MATLLGLMAAVTYGAADYLGGVASRRVGALRVVVLSQLAGLLLVVVSLPFVGGSGPGVRPIGWGAVAGIAGGVGVALLYRGLAAGSMAVVAPITAVEAAAVPVLWGLLQGERPGGLAVVGVLVALPAIVMVSAGGEVAVAPGVPAVRRSRLRALAQPGVVDALGAGIAFGAFFVLLERAGADAGAWPLLGARLASVGLLSAVALVGRRSLRPPAGSLPLIVVAGALDMEANLAYLLATGEGLLSVVAVLTSLYPASTVLLARVVLGERLARPQVRGLVLAGVGVALIALR